MDDTLARAYWPDQSAVGKRLATGTASAPRWHTIVGVVRHARHWLDRQGRMQLYRPYRQVTFHSAFVVVATAGDPGRLAGLVRGQLAALDPALPLFDVATMSRRLSDSLQTTRFTVRLLTGFALVSLLLAAGGVYSLISYAVSRQTREIGIRVALGSSRARILAATAASGIRLTAAGVLLGALGAAWLSRTLASLLFEVSPTDGATYLLVAALLLAAGAAASLVPAWRATRIDPVAAIRQD